MLRRTCLALLLLALLAPLAGADVIRLRTGESVKCRPLQDRSDDRTLVVEDLLSGAVRAFAWEALDPVDARRIRVESFRWESEASFTVKGHRVVHRLEGGDEEEIYGLIEKEEGGRLSLRRGGQVLELARAKVVEVTEEVLDPRDIWTPAQLVERQLEALKASGGELTTGQASFDFANYCEWAGALKEALDYYRRAAADPDYLSRATAEERAVKVEALLKDQAALSTLRDLKTKLGSSLFRAVRTGLDGFEAKHPDASEAVKKALESFRATVAATREKYFRRMARWEFAKIAEKLIEAKLREKDVKLADVRSWLKRDLVDKAFEGLAARMAKVDDVTVDEARGFWDKRWEGVVKSGWTRRSYTGGTFIIYPPKIQPPKPRPQPAGGANRGGAQGGGAAPVIPKPPTPDQWWAKAPLSERTQFTMALFASTSGLFEVSEDLERRPCSRCQAAGLINETMQTGAVLTYLCDRCGGAQHDITIKFR